MFYSKIANFKDRCDKVIGPRGLPLDINPLVGDLFDNYYYNLTWLSDEEITSIDHDFSCHVVAEQYEIRKGRSSLRYVGRRPDEFPGSVHPESEWETFSPEKRQELMKSKCFIEIVSEDPHCWSSLAELKDKLGLIKRDNPESKIRALFAFYDA